MANSTKGLPFKVGELLKHTAEDDALRRALVAADLTRAQDLGNWLRDQRGVYDGVVITHLQRPYWQATLHVSTDVQATNSVFP